MDAGSDLIRQILAVLLVFGLLGVAVWRLRGGRITAPQWTPAALFGAGAARGRTLEVLERQALTPQHGLHRLKVDKREFLIATHPQGCSLLAELDSASSAFAGSRERAGQ